MSQGPQFPKHLFSIDETASLEILLRSGQGLMEGGTVHRIEPVTWIERKQIDFGPLGELCRLIHHESAIVNAGLESHGTRIHVPERRHKPPRSCT